MRQIRDKPLLQIHDKGYARAYAADERKKFLLGISFSSMTGTTEKWQEEVAD